MYWKNWPNATGIHFSVVKRQQMLCSRSCRRLLHRHHRRCHLIISWRPNLCLNRRLRLHLRLNNLNNLSLSLRLNLRFRYLY